MKLQFAIATPDDAAEIAALRNAVAEDLTKRYGHGHWSHMTSEKGVTLGITNTSKILMVRKGKRLVGCLRLAQKKPWAIIDISYFTASQRPLYLLDMTVAPGLQGTGIGSEMIEQAKKFSREWPADAIRLDAYNADAGAGEFYRKCGFTEKGRVVYRNNPLIYFEMIL